MLQEHALFRTKPNLQNKIKNRRILLTLFHVLIFDSQVLLIQLPFLYCTSIFMLLQYMPVKLLLMLIRWLYYRWLPSNFSAQMFTRGFYITEKKKVIIANKKPLVFVKTPNLWYFYFSGMINNFLHRMFWGTEITKTSFCFFRPLKFSF